MAKYDIEIERTNQRDKSDKLDVGLVVEAKTAEEARRKSVDLMLDILPTGTWLINYKSVVKLE